MVYDTHTNIHHKGRQAMVRHAYTLSTRHEAILQRMSKKLDASLVNTMERALEALEVSEASRDAVVAGVVK